MKHIAIGDIHGRANWRELNIRKYEKVVFIGDYADSYDLSDFAILENLKKIISLKNRHPEKVVLLLGNHDAHYLHYPRFKCSGFRPAMKTDLTTLFRKNAECFQIAYQKGNHLFTHAGLTNSWYNEVLRSPVITAIFEKEKDLAGQLNQLERTAFRGTLYDAGIERGGYGYGGPLWADYKETSVDMLNEFHQIVGHTRVEDIHTITCSDKSVTYTDVLQHQTKFYELDI
ncbi:MAG: metallophosphoesterase [Sphingobacteriales bacterium]